MTDLNVVHLTGRCSSDVERIVHESGDHILRLLLAVRTEVPRRVDVIPVVMWDPPVDVWDADYPVGTRVWVAGSIQRRFHADGEGRQSRIEVVADSIQSQAPDRA